MKTIATLTINPAIDLNTEVDAIVREKKLRCAEPTFEPGGGGLNVSRAIARLGGTSTAIIVQGGPTGSLLLELLAREGLHTIAVPTRGYTRESINVYERSTTEQVRLILPGPPMNEDEWKDTLHAVERVRPKPDYLVASGSVPPGVPDDFFGQLSELSHRLGIELVVDTSGPALTKAVGPGTLLLKPNHNEVHALAQSASGDTPETAARRIVESGGARAIIVSLGAEGAILATKEGVRRYPAPNVKPASKVGAGDSMVAGVVLSLARGLSMEDAARFGVASGAAAVMTPGTELCTREDAEALFAAMPR
jgi:6-phosphofructokinase 2